MEKVSEVDKEKEKEAVSEVDTKKKESKDFETDEIGELEGQLGDIFEVEEKLDYEQYDEKEEDDLLAEEEEQGRKDRQYNPSK